MKVGKVLQNSNASYTIAMLLPVISDGIKFRICRNGERYTHCMVSTLYFGVAKHNMNSKTQNNSYLKNFFDIPAFFKVSKSFTRGELYREIHVILLNYDDDWDLTFDNNSYNDIRRFKNLCKHLAIKNNIPKIDKYERKRKFIAQMFSSLSGGVTNKVNVSLGKVDNLVDKFSSIVETSEKDLTKILSNVKQFTDFVIPGHTSMWTMLLSGIIKFVCLIYLLTKEQNRSIDSIIALITLALPIGIGSCLISNLQRAIQGVMVKYSSKDDLVAQDYQDDNTIVTFFKVTVELFQSFFKDIPIETFKAMSLSVSKIKLVADYLKNTNTIFEYLLSMFQRMVEIVGNKIVKYYGKLPKILQSETIDDLVDRYVEIKENRLDLQANSNSYVAKKVIEVYNDAIKIQAKMIKSIKKVDFGQTKILAYLNIIIRNLEGIVQKIPDHIKGTKNARRTKPFWLYIFGEPRIGKTAMLQPYIVNLLAQECKLIDKYVDYSEYTYFRNCGDEYWEKYTGQPVLWYNDLFQVFTNENKVNIGIEEITNVVDDNLYPLNMAFEQKHNVYFDSQLVISNAQDDLVGQPFISNKCLSGGQHIYARRNLVIRLRLNSKYKGYNGINYESVTEARNKKVEFVGDLFPSDMYNIDFMEPITGQHLKTASFKDAMRIIVHAYKNYKECQDTFKGKLFKHFEQMWTQSNEDWEKSLTQASRNRFECDMCDKLYQESSMLNEDERDDIRNVLLLSCPHKIVEVKRRWYDFGEMIKINAKAFFENAQSFLRKNSACVLLMSILAILPILSYILINYFSYGKNFSTNSHEGHLKVATKNNIRLVAQEYGQQNKDVEAKLIRNSAVISLILQNSFGEKKLTFGSVLGVGGDIFCMPKHFFDRIQDFLNNFESDAIKVELNFVGNQKYRIYAKDLVLLKVSYAHLADISFLQFPKLCCLPKIDKFFVSNRDNPVLYGSYLWGRRIDNLNLIQTITTSSIELNTRAYTHPEMELPFLGKFIPARKIVVPEGYEYNVSGVAVGDCGMVLLNIDDKLNCRKILGLHVAGTIKGNVGLSNSIFMEDVQQAYIEAGNFITMENIELLNVSEITSVCKGSLEGQFCIMGGMIHEGKKVKLSIPMKSKIQKSVFYDHMEQEFGPSTTAPARLRPFIDEYGEKISPLIKGLNKLCVSIEVPSIETIKRIGDHIYQSIISWKSPYLINPKVLTLEEALNGVDILNKIDITTSPGFPYQLRNKSGGKRDWIYYKEDILCANDELIINIEERKEKAVQGIIKSTFFVDTLKDETRDLERVKLGKTRVFQVGPMCLSILMRQYFGSFIMHCQSTYLTGEMGIGINPNSYDWTLLLRKLNRVGDKFINGDYSDYDASISQFVIMHIMPSINQFYENATDEENQIRNVLMATFLNNVHVVEDLVFQRLQGNMSGIALTTIVNCIYNMFLARYAYMKLVENDLTMFNALISATFYGDDNLICVADSIISKFNMQTYAKCMAELGIKYTDPHKNSEFKEFFLLNEISYLKRSFTLLNKNTQLYSAQLPLSVILEIPRWSESDPLNMVDQLNRFNCLLYESVNYGLDVYNKFKSVVINMIRKINAVGLFIDASQILTYYYILHSMYPQFFLCDLTKYVDNLPCLLQESGSYYSDKNESNFCSDGINSKSYKNTTNNIDDDNKYITKSAEAHNIVGKQQITRIMVAQDYSLRDYLDNITYAVNFQDEFKFTAMSSNQFQNSQENTGQTVTQSQITTTFDDNIPHIARDSFKEIVDFNPFLDISMESFIKREWYLGAITWNSTDSRTTLSEVYNLPNDLFNYLGPKLANIAYWAPDLEVIFRINGTAMHYGRYLFSAVPSEDIIDDAYISPNNASQFLFCQVSPTGNQSVVLKIPWLHYYDRVPISKTQSTIPWRLLAFPVIPLSCANTATPAPVTIATFVRITNPRFSGYTNFVPNWTTQSAEQNTLSNNENMTSQTTQEGFISIVNSTAQKIEKISGDMSQLAVDAGFSNAPNLTAVKPVINRNILLCKAEDLPNTIVLGPSQNQRVTVDNKLSNSRPDEMYIANVAGRMALLENIKISSTSAVNTNIFSLEVNPLNLMYKDYESTIAAGLCYPLPASYLSRLCRYWRGGLKLHFSFVSSGFHSLRVRLSYTPRLFDTVPDPNAGTSAYNVNQLWDINTQTDYSIRIPWHSFTEWLPMHEYSGNVNLTLISKLTSVLQTPQPIYLQVWAAMDDDFQLAYPCMKKVGDALNTKVKMYNPDFVTWTSQSSDMLESGNPFINFKNNQFPSMSSSGLANLTFESLGGFGEKRKDCRTHMSYEISSVKELANMLTPIERSNLVAGAAATAGSSFTIGRKFIPYGWVDKPANDSLWNNYFYQVMALFRYARGSVRIALESTYMNYAQVVMGDFASTWDGSFWQNYTKDNFFGTEDLSTLTAGAHLFTDLHTQPMDITIPYYSNAKTIPTTYGNAATWTMSPTHIDVNILATYIAQAAVTKDQVLATLIWFVSGGDDLQLGYQIAVPRCRYAKPAA